MKKSLIIFCKISGIVLISLIFSIQAISQMPGAITIEPPNATAYDELTLTFDPEYSCYWDGSLAGLDYIAIHSGISFITGEEWQQVINYDALGANGQSTHLLPTGDGKYSITYVPAEFYNLDDQIVTHICAVFNNGIDWGEDGRDFTPDSMDCMDFFIPIHFDLEGEIIHVPDDFATIQEAIDVSTNGDTILVADGTYIENINYNGKLVHVASHYIMDNDESHIYNTIIDADLNGPAVLFISYENLWAKLTGFTIINGSGYYDNGGALFMENASPELSNLVIKDNEAIEGGGIFAAGCELHLTDVLFENNTAEGQGGGIHAVNTHLNINLCSFTGNEAMGFNSGAIFSFTSAGPEDHYSAFIEESYFSANVADSGAVGGVYILNGNNSEAEMDVIISSCTFMSNTSKSSSALQIRGQGVYFSLNDCIFNNNTAQLYTGAASFTNGCIGNLYNCLFIFNEGAIGGGYFNSGAVTVWGGDVGFYNCTFTDNYASYGAGLSVGANGQASLTNCIFWENSVNQIALVEYNEMGAFLEVDYSNIQYGEDSVNVSQNSQLTWGTGNMDEDPFFDEMEGSILLHWDSPCIDAGTPDVSGYEIPASDIFGNVRVWDGDGDDLEVIDMGVSEFGSIPLITSKEDYQDVKKDEVSVILYPNPCSGSAHLRITNLPDRQAGNRQQITKLEVFTISGMKILEVVNEEMLPDSGEIALDLKDLPPGVYYCVLKTKSETYTTKLIKL